MHLWSSIQNGGRAHVYRKPPNLVSVHVLLANQLSQAWYLKFAYWFSAFGFDHTSEIWNTHQVLALSLQLGWLNHNTQYSSLVSASNSLCHIFEVLAEIATWNVLSFSAFGFHLWLLYRNKITCMDLSDNTLILHHKILWCHPNIYQINQPLCSHDSHMMQQINR